MKLSEKLKAVSQEFETWLNEQNAGAQEPNNLDRMVTLNAHLKAVVADVDAEATEAEKPVPATTATTTTSPKPELVKPEPAKESKPATPPATPTA